MKYNDALKELQFNRSRKFALTGEEQYLKDQFQSLMLGMHKDASIASFRPGEETEARNVLFSTSLFDDTVIVLHYFDQMKNEGLKDVVKDYDGNLVVLFSDQANLKSQASSSVLGSCTHVQCDRMPEYGPEYPTWILSHASRHGFTFIDGAEDLLFRGIGADLMSLSGELFKLYVYKDSTKTIYPEDIEKVTISTATGSTYDILDSILRKDASKVVKGLERFFNGNNSVEEFLWFLAHYFEKLYRILLMDEQKFTPENMAHILNIPPFIVKHRYLPRSKSIGKDVVGRWINGIYNLDVSMRTFGGDRRILMLNFILVTLQG